MELPETRYARSGDVSIAYQVRDGPFDLVQVPPFVSHVELSLAIPAAEAVARGLASYSRLIRFDKRGTGMSDRVTGAPSLETRMDDVRAVMDAVGSKDAALLGQSEGGPMSVLFAATHPERVWIESFLKEAWEARTWQEAEPDRVLATVLFTDIDGSTAKAAELGDAGWRDLVQAHHGLVRRQLARYRGTEIDTAGDGFFASFDGPARAIRCACAIRESVRELGIEIRAGLHTGECERIDQKVGGIAVSIGARVASNAQAGEVLVSSTVKDLVAGSGIQFAERGTAELKGVPGEWRLYAVEAAPA